MAGQRKLDAKKEPEVSEEIRYEQHLEDIGAVEKMTWFSVFVRLLFVVWVFGLLMFIFMWVTTGFQGGEVIPRIPKIPVI